MQGHRSTTDLFPEILSFGDASTSDDTYTNQQICFNNMHNSADNNTVRDYLTSPNDASIVYHHFPTQQGHNFNGWTMGGPSSIVPQNYNTHHVHVQSPNNLTSQDLNTNNENLNDDSDDCRILETPPVPFSTGSVNLLDSRRMSCKRKSLERNLGQSSKSESSSSFQPSQGSVWQALPNEHNASSSSLSPSMENLNGTSSGEAATESPFTLNLNGNSQNSSQNDHSRTSPHQVDSVTINLPSTRTSLFADHLLVENSSPQMQPGALHVASSRRTQNPSRWTEGSSLRRGLLSSSRQRNETTLPRNLREHHPVFMPTNNPSNSAQNSAGASLGAHISGPNGVSHRNNPQYQRRLSELVRRSLLASADNGGQGSNSAVPSGAISFPAGNQGNQLLNSRSGLLLGRQHDGVIGLPHSLRGMASGSEGRSRLVSEIRSVLDLMRRGEELRFEDVVLLDQSMLFGMTNIHDRHRDMRLDTDNMSYEELLALEERIGYVNTGLNEKTILNCLIQRKYFSIAMNTKSEVEPCCVCQENYNDGEDVGRLECGHEFHSVCIKQWLMLKNLCPICKTTAFTL